MYNIYAEVQDLEDYLKTEYEEDEYMEIERLLERASELIQARIMCRYDPDNIKTQEALKLATCAQAEYWLELGEGRDIEEKIDQLQLDDYSVTYMDGVGGGGLAPRAKNYLMNLGLLYRGSVIKW